jgi:hypothetical protein
MNSLYGFVAVSRLGPYKNLLCLQSIFAE